MQALHDRLDNAGMETLRSMDELNALYFPLSGSEITIEETDVSNLSRIELVRRILEKPDTVKYTYFTRINYSKYTNTESWIDVAAKRAEMEANEEYIRRKAYIED